MNLKRIIGGAAATGAIVGGSFLIGDTYFNDSEFASPDNAQSYRYFDPTLRAKLDTLRHDWGAPIRINSAVRTRAHNRRVGGVDGSSHSAPCYCAVDIHISSSEMRWFVINWAIEHKINRIGVGKNFIHLDLDDSKPNQVIWTY